MNQNPQPLINDTEVVMRFMINVLDFDKNPGKKFDFAIEPGTSDLASGLILGCKLRDTSSISISPVFEIRNRMRCVLHELVILDTGNEIIYKIRREKDWLSWLRGDRLIIEVGEIKNPFALTPIDVSKKELVSLKRIFYKWERMHDPKRAKY